MQFTRIWAGKQMAKTYLKQAANVQLMLHWLPFKFTFYEIKNNRNPLCIGC